MSGWTSLFTDIVGSTEKAVELGDGADDKCAGLAIHIGARIAGLAAPDEILVSEAVKEAAGPAYEFTDRGDEDLDGVPGRWHLYAVPA